MYKGSLLQCKEVRPKVNPLDNTVNNLQKINSFWFVKHNVILTIPKSPYKSTNTNANSCFSLSINSIQPMSKHIGYTCWWININGEVTEPPNMPHKTTCYKEMLDNLIGLAKHTLFTAIPSSFNQIIFSKQHLFLLRNHMKILIFNGTFNSQKYLRRKGVCPFMKSSHIYLIANFPSVVRFHAVADQEFV